MAGAKHSSSWHPRAGDFLKENIVFNLYSLAVQICLKSRLLSCCVWSGVGPLWWSWGADPDGHVWGHNSGQQPYKLTPMIHDSSISCAELYVE